MCTLGYIICLVLFPSHQDGRGPAAVGGRFQLPGSAALAGRLPSVCRWPNITVAASQETQGGAEGCFAPD